MTKLYVITARARGGILMIAPLPDGATFADKDEALQILRDTGNVPSDILELSVTEFIENNVMATRKFFENGSTSTEIFA
jgi:hypothetical protein